jgi:hypothetical protein
MVLSIVLGGKLILAIIFFDGHTLLCVSHEAILGLECFKVNLVDVPFYSAIDTGA